MSTATNTTTNATDVKKTVKLTINGKNLEAHEGETVLEVARREGIDIPSLCHISGTAPWAACRLCLVEVEGIDKLQAACTTWVADGMAVKTDTPRVHARRESYLKMYLSDHNSYCEAPCSHACPTHIDIPAYMAALAAGDAAGAADIVRRDLPFPGILGRLCPRYCEPVCRRAQVDEPVAICSLHRAAADYAGTEAPLSGAAPSGKRVAVVGAGAAGLAAAWFLVSQGHQVTVYDSNEKPGGPLRYLVPEFKLPQEVLDGELQPLWDAGVRFVGNSKLGLETEPETLLDAGFDAVVVSLVTSTNLGHMKPSDGAVDALELLRKARRGEVVALAERVIVAGDDVATIDAARTARRLGASDVIVITSGEPDLGTLGSDIADAREEGITFAFGTTLAQVNAPGTTVIIARDTTAGAVRLQTHRYTGRTSREGLFAAGDLVSGEVSFIHAIAGGKRAALAVDAWLRGIDLEKLEAAVAAFDALPYLQQLDGEPELGSLGRRLAERAPVWLKMGASADKAARATMPVPDESERFSGVGVEATQGFTFEQAQAEAKRCLQCTCPSLGACELQRLGVDYGITSNELVTPGSRVRVVEPQYEHPFIRRAMERCISCGRCVRVCRDVAGPACYDFTGRGFTMNVDTPYSEALQLADCISCGRCVSTCPTGALTFNERALSSFKLDESRCVTCNTCVDVCPVNALETTNHFENARTSWLELIGKGSGLAGGHRMCAGCGAPIVVRQVLMGASDPVVVAAATGCLEVSTTIYPYTSWKGSFIHTAFENSAATLSGVETAYRALKKKEALPENVKFIAFGGDGGTYDIGLQSLSGAMERGHKMLYVCYDNGAYMNTGFQRSGATPEGAWTTTSPVGHESAGKLQHRKNLTEIMVAHGIKYVAQASPHDPRDLVRKSAKALSVDGPAFLNILAPCPRGWRADGAETVDLAREAVNSCYWPLFEVEEGEYRLTYRPHHKLPLAPWLKRQGRFAHLFQADNAWQLKALENWVDEEWEKLLRKCGEPSEADWQAHLQANGCLLR